MAEYQLKNDSIEAWRIGDEDAPEWVAGLIADGTIKFNQVDGTISVGTDDGPQKAQVGDYVAFSPSIQADPTPEFPQGEVLEQQSVQLFTKGEFETLYDIGDDDIRPVGAGPIPSPDPVVEQGEDLERQYR